MCLCGCKLVTVFVCVSMCMVCVCLCVCEFLMGSVQVCIGHVRSLQLDRKRPRIDAASEGNTMEAEALLNTGAKGSLASLLPALLLGPLDSFVVEPLTESPGHREWAKGRQTQLMQLPL